MKKNVYQWLKWFGRLKNQRIRLGGVLFLHVCRRRYLGVFLDPVMACNLRCQMCYFSDPECRKTLVGKLTWEDIEAIARAFFRRTLKLQIGCGAEPTLYDRLTDIVRLGRQYNIPYISLTTNGQLLTYDKLKALAEAGLDEITVSAHGLVRETYERFMVNGRFDLFRQLLTDVTRLKQEYPRFKLRINYTLNEDNVEELIVFEDVVGTMPVDVLQLRPIQPLGQTAYRHFSLQKVLDGYDRILLPLVRVCRDRGIVCMVPTRENLLTLEKDGGESEPDNVVEELTYCYLSPNACWKEGFDYHHDTFEKYCRRTHRATYILRRMFGPLKKSRKKHKEITRKLNYSIK